MPLLLLVNGVYNVFSSTLCTKKRQLIFKFCTLTRERASLLLDVPFSCKTSLISGMNERISIIIIIIIIIIVVVVVIIIIIIIIINVMEIISVYSTDVLSKDSLTSVVAAIPFSWILFRCFVLVLRLTWLTRTFSACLWVMFLKADQRLRLFHRFLSMALMLLQWWDHFCCNSSWGIGMDNFSYTHTRTRTYSSKRICKNISPILRSQAVRNFLNGLYSVLFFCLT